MYFLSAHQQKKTIINNLIKKETEKNEQEENNSNLKFSSSLIATTRNFITSLGTGIIPFIEHNDANRTLMGANMQKQALPLLKKEIAQITTGIEVPILKSSQYTIISKNSGIIEFANTKRINIGKFQKYINIDINKSILQKYKNKIKNNKNIIKTLSYEKEVYKLKTVKKSNQNNYVKQRNTIGKEQWTKKGQIINESNGTQQGKLSLGRNLLIGYMSWEGYNFEDAIVINKNLIDNNILTSIKTKKEKIFLIKNEKEEVRFRK